MFNQVVLVGKIKEIKEGVLKVIVARPDSGEHDTLTVRMTRSIKSSVQDYCQEGDVVGIKAKIYSENDEMYLQAEKITFLTSREKKD